MQINKSPALEDKQCVLLFIPCMDRDYKFIKKKKKKKSKTVHLKFLFLVAIN